MALSLPSDEELVAEINKHFRNYLSNPENLESATNTLLDDIIEDAILGVVFEVHMERKTKLHEIIVGESDDEKYKIIDALDLDIFGQAPGKKNYECICPSCNRSLAASRFAPHLEKCMGMGRNSSRLASRRIQTTANKETTGALSDDEDDADWTVGNEKKGKSKPTSSFGTRKEGTNPFCQIDFYNPLKNNLPDLRFINCAAETFVCPQGPRFRTVFRTRSVVLVFFYFFLYGIDNYRYRSIGKYGELYGGGEE